MEKSAIIFILYAVLAVATGNTPAPQTQRFQANTFLDMLGKTFDPKVAYTDLLTALLERLNMDPINLSNNSTVVTSSGPENPNAMADTTVNCPAAPIKMGTSITYTNDARVPGSRAFYQCEVGHNGKSKFIQCLSGGQWSSLGGWPGCIPVDCGAPPPNVANADPTYERTTYGSVVIYNCRPGYKMDVSSANVTCLETGVWDTPVFKCEMPAMNGGGFAALSSMFNGGGGNPAASPTNQNPMMAAFLKNMQGMQGLGGLAGMQSGMPSSLAQAMGQQPSQPSPPPSNNNNNPMAAMIAQMFPGMSMGGAPPTTTPSPPINSGIPGMPSMPGGFQLPSHLQSLLPNGLSNTAGMKPQDLMTLASAGLGSGTAAGAPRDITQLLGSMNPMSMFGMGMGPGATAGGAGGAGGPPPDPEKMAEQREEMMMRAMMANAMKSMMSGGGNQGGGNNQTSQNARNPAMEMMTLMALQSGLAGGGGGGGGGGAAMDPLSMMLGGMNPAMLGMGGGGGGGGGGLFGGLFGGA